MFVPINIDTTLKMSGQVNDLMRMSNSGLLRAITDFKSQWRHFWDTGLTVEEMQAQLDILATTPATDAGGATNALAAYFAKAQRWIGFFLAEDPSSFDDARLEVSGALRPGSTEPYREYLTPGWIFTVDLSTGRIIVTEPCNWESEA